VLARSKRRASFYTLPIVVVIGFLVVAGLAAWQRADVIADLADQVARGDKSEATAAVRKLAAIPRPPISVLVDAATSDERATAEAAQVAINKMLSKWQKQVEKKQRISSVASQLTELAEALAAQRRAFAPADYPWLASATRKIVWLANECPAKKTPLVALHCDEIMSIVGRNSLAAPISGHEDSTEDLPRQDAATPVEEATFQDSRQARLELDFSEFPTQRVTVDGDAAPQAPATTSPPPIQSLSVNETRLEPQVGPGPPKKMAAPSEPAQRPNWSQPSYRVLPGAPVENKVEEIATPKSAPKIPQEATSKTRMMAIETRTLFAQWLAAKGDEIQFVEHDLATRGFKHMSKPLVEQYLSNDVEVRLKLVESVLAEANVDPRPWLYLLADDENADVRLLAVTMMATSNDKSLVEKAWQVAIRDRDPRIADLAARIRARR
jgi:hypothetical protein